MLNQSRDNCIKLSFPVNAAYVSSARLTASSVANRMNFDIDEIEDIKTAVSEACTYIIKSLTNNVRSSFDITFVMGADSIEINISSQGSIASVDPKDMSLMMIKAMVDEFEIKNSEKSCVTINMKKKHKMSIFD